MPDITKKETGFSEAKAFKHVKALSQIPSPPFSSDQSPLIQVPWGVKQKIRLMYHKICLCFGIGIEFEIMSVATDKASFRVIELQGQVVILRKCFHPLHLISILVHRATQRTGWCCQFQGISLLLDPMYVNL